RVRLGIALVARGKHRAAEKHFRRGLKIAPEDPEVWSGLATALRGRGKLAAAEEAHREALKHAPNHAPFHLNLADTLLRLNRAREAAREVDAARALDPRHPLLPNFVAAVKFALSIGGDR
ncbi:MAG: tetratricopeptide repeat protein, partial [Planctomycetes bacterium]|nr:tetratricopeptide repeat protein [Planctomycetota bacterium]